MKAHARFLFAALFTAACASPPAPNLASNAASNLVAPSSASDEDEALDSATDPASVEAPSSAAARTAPIVNSNNAFAASLWGVLRARPGNLAVSPASISMALAMIFGGARGETAAEIKRALHFEAEPEEVMRSAGEVLQGWNAGKGPTILRAVNRLFVEKTYTLEKPFLDATQRALGAPLGVVDFVKSPEQARQHINRWVQEETNYRVIDLVPREGIDVLTRLVLVDAIYFNADWAAPFDASDTRPKPFYVTSTNKKDVPMMGMESTLRFADLGGVRIIEKLYKGKDASMVLVLPDTVDGLPALEQSLSAADLDRWIDAMKPERVAVTLPRFEIDPPSTIALRDTLQALGMQLAFERLKADFTGIANPKERQHRLFIKDVFHKAFVKLDEKGTEAAAVTADVFSARGGMLPEPPKPKIFRADHPFLFVLRDTKTGMILFMGRVADPSAR